MLVNVYLTSGCPAGPIGATQSEACETLAAQAEPPERWIEAQTAAGRRLSDHCPAGSSAPLR